ncbi:PH domain-containing protein [Alcaligenes sp. SMD-FA]|uniref:PH domain-containing protein n=1 Tax=Alcaligenes sp. SMD-FA TaxID=2991054 RepID=UPI0022261F6F|nr:PH domain-containing protein [Alcaligenes sp. SMD-FA]UYY85574.1 PH domain-containing protein [Alcaligenes sp. SMD-FA]
MDPIDTLPQAAASHGQAHASTRETKLIWADTEGQLANTGWFIVAILFCWTVIPVLWAIYRYLKVANHRYELTNQRLLEYSGIIVKHVETLELYRVKDIAVSGTLFQALFGHGRVILQTTDASTPTVHISAIASPQHVSQLIRDAVEHCRVARDVRAFDY